MISFSKYSSIRHQFLTRLLEGLAPALADAGAGLSWYLERGIITLPGNKG
jgi:hypothetical protein